MPGTPEEELQHAINRFIKAIEVPSPGQLSKSYSSLLESYKLSVQNLAINTLYPETKMLIDRFIKLICHISEDRPNFLVACEILILTLMPIQRHILPSEYSPYLGIYLNDKEYASQAKSKISELVFSSPSLFPPFWWTIFSRKYINDCSEFRDALAVMIVDSNSPFDIPMTDDSDTIESYLNLIDIVSNSGKKHLLISTFLGPSFAIEAISTGTETSSGFHCYKAKFKPEIKTNITKIFTNLDQDYFNKLINNFILAANLEISHSVLAQAQVSVLRLRKILRLLLDPKYTISIGKITNESENIQMVRRFIYNMSSFSRRLMAHALAFDFGNPYLAEQLSDPDADATLVFCSQLGVVFSPLFLSLERNSFIPALAQVSLRNKRMKVSGDNVNLVSAASDLFENPVSFELLLPGTEIMERSFIIRLSLKKTWTPQTALEFAKKSTGGSVSAMAALVRSASKVQVSFCTLHPLNAKFMSENFLHDCFVLAESSKTSQKEFETIFEAIWRLISCAPSISEVTAWLSLLETSFPLKPSVLRQAVVHSFSHFFPDSCRLIPIFLESYPSLEPSELVSLSSLRCVSPNSSDWAHLFEANVSNSLTSLSSRRGEKELGTLISLLYQELYSDAELISDPLKAAFLSFLSIKDQKQCREMRMLTALIEDLPRIDKKFPGFSDALYDSILGIAKNPDISISDFRIFVSMIVDTLCNVRKDGFEELQKLSDYFSDLKQPEFMKILKSAVEQYTAFSRGKIVEAPQIENRTAYVTSKGHILHSLDYSGMSLHLTTKTPVGSVSHKVVTEGKAEMKERKYSNSDCQVQYFESEADQFSKTFAEVADHIISLGVDEYKPAPRLEESKGSMPLLNLFNSSDAEQPYKSDTHTPSLDMNSLESIYSNVSASVLFSTFFDQSSMKIFRPFKILDIAAANVYSIPVRETLKIGLLYVKEGQIDQNSILRNEWSSTSDTFRSFLLSIATFVDLATHQGFNGKLDNTNFSNGRYHPYYSNSRFEIMFHAAPVIPTDHNDNQQIYKKRHIGNDNVHIVWSEHFYDYDPLTITSHFNDAHVVVYPIKNTKDVYRVVVHRKNPSYRFGPLTSDVILGKRELTSLVRWTAIFADRVAREATSEYLLPEQLYEDAFLKFLSSRRSED